MCGDCAGSLTRTSPVQIQDSTDDSEIWDPDRACHHADVPSPVGHVLGGLAAGLLAGPAPDRRILTVCAVAAVIPDVDLFLPVPHRGPLHSLATAVLVGVIALVVIRQSRSHRDPTRAAFAVALAYGSHVLLDWMGADTSTPRGLMALWPTTSDYFIADVTIFRAISRRYWMTSFWWDNTVAVLQELAILVPPVALLAWRQRSTRRR